MYNQPIYTKLGLWAPTCWCNGVLGYTTTLASLTMSATKLKITEIPPGNTSSTSYGVSITILRKRNQNPPLHHDHDKIKASQNALQSALNSTKYGHILILNVHPPYDIEIIVIFGLACCFSNHLWLLSQRLYTLSTLCWSTKYEKGQSVPLVCKLDCPQPWL